MHGGKKSDTLTDRYQCDRPWSAALTSRQAKYKKEATPLDRRKLRDAAGQECKMHTQVTQTPARAIYWTTSAETEWFEQRQFRLSRDAKRPSSRADVEEYAREQGADHVSRALVLEYFGGVL